MKHENLTQILQKAVKQAQRAVMEMAVYRVYRNGVSSHVILKAEQPSPEGAHLLTTIKP